MLLMLLLQLPLCDAADARVRDEDIGVHVEQKRTIFRVVALAQQLTQPPVMTKIGLSDNTSPRHNHAVGSLVICVVNPEEPRGTSPSLMNAMAIPFAPAAL